MGSLIGFLEEGSWIRVLRSDKISDGSKNEV